MGLVNKISKLVWFDEIFCNRPVFGPVYNKISPMGQIDKVLGEIGNGTLNMDSHDGWRSKICGSLSCKSYIYHDFC